MLMYAQYPHILLEDTFSNKDATTSEELLLLSQYAFKDKMKPERDYKITYINSSALDGYIDSELKIGDYVVHENHGLGIYQGIEKIEIDKVDDSRQ